MSRSTLTEYQDRYELARLARDADGVLEITLHTRGGPLEQGRESNMEWAQMFDDVRRDPDNRVVILTGTGDAMTPPQPVPGGPGRTQPADAWHRVWREGMATIQSIVDIPVPVIAAINGPVHRHPELPLLSDTVLATPDTVFQDECHMPQGLLPGDGMHVVMPLLLGRLRGSYFLLTGQVLGAEAAKAMGLINEIVPREQLLDRAREIAHDLLRHGDPVLRYTRYLLTHELKARLHTLMGAGLALEGLAAASTDWSQWVDQSDDAGGAA